MLWKTFASVFGKRRLVRPFLEPFDFVLIRSTTSEMMPCTFSLSPSVLYKKLFTRKAAMYSLYLSETSSWTAVIFLHLWKTFRFLFIVPKLGLFFVSSVELHKELDELNGVDEQHGELRREESSKLVYVLNLRWEIRTWSSCTSTSREFILAIFWQARKQAPQSLDRFWCQKINFSHPGLSLVWQCSSDLQ